MWKQFKTLTLNLLNSERGEVGEDVSEDPGEQVISLDEGEETVDSDEADNEEVPQDPDEEVQTDEVEVEEPIDEKSELQKELDRLKAEKEKLQKDRDRAFYNLRKAKAENKPDKKDSEVEFSDTQLLQLIEEHRDDPAVMLQLMKQVSKQQGKAQAVDAVKAAEIKQVKSQMDNFLVENFPAYVQDETVESQELTKAKALLSIDDHPFSDFLSVAGMMLMRLPAIQKEAFENGKAEALKKNGEDTRKRNIRESNLGPGKPKTKAAVVSDTEKIAKANAKQMGMTESQYKRYLQLLKGAKQRVVTVDG